MNLSTFRQGRESMNTVLRDRKALLAFVGPALLIYLVVLFVPIVWSIGYSFFEARQFVDLSS